MSFPASLLLPAAALLLLAGCSPKTDDSAAVATGRPDKADKKAIVGTIRLLEHHYTLGIRNTDYVLLTIDGPRLRREVRHGSFTGSTSRHGLIVDLRTDSVTYYIQDANRNGYHRLDSTTYLALVAAKKEVFATANRRPYSIVFAPLPPNLPAVSSAALAPAANLRPLAGLQALLFMLPDAARCDVIYSERLQVSQAALAYIEYQPPAALPTLALAVRYTRPPRNQSAPLLDRLKQEFDYALTEETEFDSFSPTVSAHAFDLPAGSTGDLAATWSGPASSGGRHHHHHD